MRKVASVHWREMTDADAARRDARIRELDLTPLPPSRQRQSRGSKLRTWREAAISPRTNFSWLVSIALGT